MKLEQSAPPELVRADATIAGSGDHYTYVHRDSAGHIFYVGKGTGKRAWSLDRQDFWHVYRQERSNGTHSVQIVERFLTGEEALEAEDELISHYHRQLVNYMKPGRQQDDEAIELFNHLRDENQSLMERAKSLELSDLDAAIVLYKDAFNSMWQYSHLKLEHGLIGELTTSWDRADHNLLNRLTRCLFKARRYEELVETLTVYDGRSNNKNCKAYLAADKRRKKSKVLLSRSSS